jgi:hypothetical protein
MGSGISKPHPFELLNRSSLARQSPLHEDVHSGMSTPAIALANNFISRILAGSPATRHSISAGHGVTVR